MTDELDVLSPALQVAILQPRPFELEAVAVTSIALMDPDARAVCQWVRGALHAGTSGDYLEFWDRDENGLPGERHHAFVGQVIVRWPDGTYQVLSREECNSLFITVGARTWRRST